MITNTNTNIPWKIHKANFNIVNDIASDFAPAYWCGKPW
jgi:hypothetical protein